MKHLFITLLLISSICSQETIAVLTFDGKNISSDEAFILSDRLATEIYKLGIYTVIERSRIDEVLKEQGFQQTGCTTNECAVEVGKLLGVKKIITGSIGRIGSLYTISARIISAESGEIEKQVSKDLKGSLETMLIETMAEVAAELSGTSNIKKPVAEARVTEKFVLSGLSVNSINICESINISLRKPVNAGKVFPVTLGQVYCFTNIKNTLNERTILYEWYFQGNYIDKISVKVGRSNSFRSWTYKTITKVQIGEWYVLIRDKETNIVLEKTFFSITND